MQLVILRNHESGPRFERRLPFVAILAVAIDRREIDPVVEPVLYDVLEFRRRQVVPHRGILVMTLGAVLFELCVMTGNLSRAEKFLANPLLKNELLKKDDARDAAGDRKEAGAPTRNPPRMLPLVITEIAFVALGNLFLGASGRSHDPRSIIKKRHVGVPDREHQKQK